MGKQELTNEQIYKEAGKRNFDGVGYDLLAIEAFIIGAKIAVKLKKEGRAILNYDFIEEGYDWAVKELWPE